MLHLRRTVLATVALALCVAPVAAAQDPRGDGRAVVTPVTGQLLGEFWAQIYSLPASENPFAGNGDPCLTVGRKVIQEVGGPCTVEQGTALTLGFGAACSNVEEPPSYGADEAAQRACALAADEAVLGMTVSVDGGAPVDIHRRQFEVFSPQRTVLLPADNILGVDEGLATLTAHGWGAVVRNLRPGQHVITGDTEFADGHLIVRHILNVVPR